MFEFIDFFFNDMETFVLTCFLVVLLIVVGFVCAYYADKM